MILHKKCVSNLSFTSPVYCLKSLFLAQQKRRDQNKKCLGYFEEIPVRATEWLSRKNSLQCNIFLLSYDVYAKKRLRMS